LADGFERANHEFVAVVAHLAPAQWQTVCSNEQRSVAALARHVASGYAVERDAFRAMAEGRPGRVWTRPVLDKTNAEDGAKHAACDQAETVALLQQEAAATVAFVRSLSDQQLAQAGAYLEGMPAMTVAEWIERVLVGHPMVHLRSIRTAIEPDPA
jgi:hypothetical protein